MGFTGLLVVCALFVVGVIIQRQFFPAKPQPRQLHTRQVKNWQQLKLTGQRTGPANAPVQIVEFFDYECPFCKASEPAIKAVRQKYPKKVSIVHEDFPLVKIHPFAFKASIAAECARKQNAFMAYHDALFANQSQLGSFSYTKLAARTGVADTTEFHRCVEDQKTAGIIKSNKTLGKKLNIRATPTFLINGTLVVGELSKQRLNGLVQSALAKAGE